MFTTTIRLRSSNRCFPAKRFGSRIAHPSMFVSVCFLLFLSSDANLLAHPSSRESPAKALQQEVTTLSPAAILERQLKGGEVQNFRVSLAPGQFLHVLVAQRGIDVVATAFNPGGKQLFSVDSPNGSWGTEPVIFIAETAGDYRIEVRAVNDKAPAARYEIKVVALREAAKADGEHVAARRAFEEADNLRQQSKVDSKRAAIEKYKQALNLFQMAGARDGQALTLYALGLVHAELGEFRSTLEFTGQALPLFKALGDDTMEGFALNLTGSAYDFLGEVAKAVGYLQQALLLFQKQGNQASEASVVNNIGRIYYQNADWQEALENYSQALSLFRLMRDRNREATALQNLGVIYYSLGEPKKALDYFQQALLLGRAVGDKRREALAVSEVGFVWNSLAEPRKALDHYNQALPIWQALGDRNGLATTFDFMGIAYSALGDTEKALNYHQQALELRRAAGNRREEANTLGNMGHVYNQLAQPQKALEHYRQALTLFRALGDKNRVAIMLQGIALSERQLGNRSEARQRIEEALSLVEAVRAGTGSQQFRASYFASQRDPYELYIDLLMELHRLKPTEGHDAEALQASERGRARSLTEMLHEAHVDIRQGVGLDLIAKERELNQLLNAKAQREIQLKAQKGNQQEIATLDKEISTLEDDYQQVQVAIRKASPAYAALTQPQPLGLKEIQAQLNQGTLLLEYSLGKERSFVWAVTPTSLKAYELPKREQIETAARLLYDLLTARSKSIAGENAEQKQARIAQADSQLLTASNELSQMVLGPIGSELAAERLVVVADGALQYVPFSTLPFVRGRSSVAQRSRTNNGPLTNYRPLIVDHEVISLPSASALAIQREGLRNRIPAPNGVAVIADPVFAASDERVGLARTKAPIETQGDGSAPTRIIEHLADDSGLIIRRLKFTRQEADQILAEAPRGKNLRAIDFQANRARATGGELSKYRYVHFATHGYIDSERSDLSAIVLSLVDEQGKPQDGFLRAHEIYNLNLPAELVVLSACETGLGKEIRGEGLVGLTRGFMYAGARRVVVSLWNVNDKATAELMARFYRGMLRENKTPAAALRAAQIEMSRQKQWQSPYYWAAFTLQGEWK
ncbi:MAG TPA: CHAT domain-containing protein [Pyrinomonadaceae bacterium]|nr:CHAT domain-containing protein [Pyrinomonadaceae bacterium]